MKLTAAILSLARADLWPAKWNPSASPSTCGAHDAGDPDIGGACMEGTDCCFVCPDPGKKEYRVPLIECGDKFAPNGCAGQNEQGCTCNAMTFEEQIELFSADYIFEDDLRVDPSPLNDCKQTATHDCDTLGGHVDSTKTCASAMANSVQNKDARPTDGKRNIMQTNDGFATLAGAHQHMTYHIEEPLKDQVGISIEQIFNDVCTTGSSGDIKNCLALQVELNKVQVRIDGQFAALDNVLEDLENRNNALLSLLAKLESEEVDKCPNRVCQCEKGYYWDPDQLKCVLCIGEINADGVCEECPADQYFDPSIEPNGACVNCGENFEPIWIDFPAQCNPEHIGDKDECCRPCDEEEEDWNPVFGRCMPKIREAFGTGVVLLVGGNDIYQETTDAIVFCPGAVDEDDMEFVGDVIDNQAYKSTMKAHSATFNPFYYNQTGLNNAYSRLVFGGIGSEEVVRAFVDSEYQGNNQGLAERPLAAYLLEEGEEVDPDMWHIPSNVQPRENGESGTITEVGKKRHRGISCRPETDCFPDNFLIGGQIDGSHASRALYRWDFRGFVDKDPDASNGHMVAWDAAPPLIEGRRDFAAVALGTNDRFCQMILVCGGEGSKPSSDPTPNYLKTCECLTRVNGENEWVKFAHDLPYPTIGSELVAVLSLPTEDNTGAKVEEDIYHLGGDQVRNSGPVPTNLIRKLTDSGWQDIATMHHARGFHRSWVSYGWDAVPSYELPLIFSVGGDGTSVMELEVFDVNSRYSDPLEDEATFDQRFDFDIMEFGNCQFDLDQLPFYNDPCADSEYCIA